MHRIQAKPFLKWAGGKRQLLHELLARLPRTFNAFHEPFLGGGALFFRLFSKGLLTRACISDINRPLIETYLAVRDSTEEVIACLGMHRNEENYYYSVRDRDPERLSSAERAARIIYLNKTCYNGLYRENSSGRFNVPWGRHKNPLICDEATLCADAVALRSADIGCREFKTVLDRAEPGDLVYFDPPYHPVSGTAYFTAYDRSGFGESDQIALRDLLERLASRAIHVILSNSDTPFVRNLYQGLAIHEVKAQRAINSKASRRGKVGELIICTYG